MPASGLPIRASGAFVSSALALLACLASACASHPAAPAPAPTPALVPAPPSLPSDPTTDADPPPTRLPSDVVPTHYALALTIDPAQPTFAGATDIDVTMARVASRIWIHGKNLTVSEVTATAADGHVIPGAWRVVDPSEGLARIVLASPVGPGPVRLHLAYTAPFDETLNGLYRVSVHDDRYAFTQFEDIAARNAFPSFDEPRFKTPYDVTLVAPAALGAFANTRELPLEPVGSQLAPPPGLVRHRFATSEPLPTYLIAWVVGPVDVVSATLPPNEVRTTPLTLRGLAARGRGADLAYAMAHTPPMVEALERWFQIAYPYDKLDIVAVPDFDAGAMENAGLVMFRDTLLLLGAHPPATQQRSFAFAVSHELAHQWFGNLVTMAWWDDLWLNEAFATWMETPILAATQPELRPEVAELSVVFEAFDADRLASARQIRQPILSRDDIANAFDGITYSKGASVLMTISRWLGPDVFQRGIHRYLVAHAGKSATTADLTAAITAESGRNVAPVLDGLTLRAGIPLLETSITCAPDGPASLTYVQRRYLPVGSPPDAALPAPWSVPVCTRYQAGGTTHQTCAFLDAATTTIALEGGCPEWVLPNAEGGSYVRFVLPDAWLAKLAVALAAPGETFGTRDRMVIADSVRAGFSAARITFPDALAVLAPLAASPDRTIATAPIELLAFAHAHLLEPRDDAAFRRYARDLYRAPLRRLGWGTTGADESTDVRLLRGAVLSFLALDVRDPDTRREAARRGRAYIAGGTLHPAAVPADLAALALTVAIQEGDDAFFDRVLALLATVDDGQLRSVLVHALGGDDRDARRARVLGLALDPRLRVNEATWPLSLQFDGARGAASDVVWSWLADHYAALAGRLSPEAAGYLPFIAQGFCSLPRAALVGAFLGPRLAETMGGPRNLAATVETITLCAARADAQRESARAFFRHAKAR